MDGWHGVTSSQLADWLPSASQMEAFSPLQWERLSTACLDGSCWLQPDISHLAGPTCLMEHQYWRQPLAWKHVARWCPAG